MNQTQIMSMSTFAPPARHKFLETCAQPSASMDIYTCAWPSRISTILIVFLILKNHKNRKKPKKDQSQVYITCATVWRKYTKTRNFFCFWFSTVGFAQNLHLKLLNCEENRERKCYEMFYISVINPLFVKIFSLTFVSNIILFSIWYIYFKYILNVYININNYKKITIW